MRARLSARRRALAIVAAVLCALGLGVAAHFQTVTNSNNAVANRTAAHRLAGIAAQFQTVRASYIFACERLNVVIVQINRSQFADYTLLKLSLRLARHAPDATTEGTAALAVALHAQSWVMPTDCARTVEKEGSHYRLAEPVSFDVAAPPPAALAIPTVRLP